MLYKSDNAAYSNNGIIGSQFLDNIDFGEIIPTLHCLDSGAYKSASFYSDPILEFDLTEFPEFCSLAPPVLSRRHACISDDLKFSDLTTNISNGEFHIKEIPQFELPSSSPPPSSSSKNNGKRVNKTKTKNQPCIGHTNDFDVLISTLYFLKLHKENISPKHQNETTNKNSDDDNDTLSYTRKRDIL